MIKSVYALVGSDLYLQLQKQNEILRLAPPDSQRIDLDGERAELAQVLDEVRSFAMFGGYKLVTVRDAEEFISRYRDSLEDYLASPVDSATLVFRCETLLKTTRIYKLIDKLGGIMLCEPPPQITPWITKQAREVHGLNLTPEAATLLGELVGADLGRIDNELAKLALSAGNSPVSPKDITGTVAFQKELEMMELTNALTVGNISEAVRRWRQLMQLDPGSEYRVFTWIANWLIGVQKGLKLKLAGRNEFEVCREARVYGREMQQPFIRTMMALGENGVRQALTQLVEVEYQSKTGIGDAAENIERFLLSLKLR